MHCDVSSRFHLEYTLPETNGSLSANQCLEDEFPFGALRLIFQGQAVSFRLVHQQIQQILVVFQEKKKRFGGSQLECKELGFGFLYV